MIALKTGGSGFLNTKFLLSGTDIYLTGSSLLFDTTKGIDSKVLGATLYVGNTNASVVSIGNGGTINTNGTLTTTIITGTTITLGTSVTSPLFIGGSGATSGISYQGSTNASVTSTAAAHTWLVGNSGGTTAGIIYHSGAVNIGNASSGNQRLFQIGQDTAFMSFGSLVGTTSEAAIYFNQTTPSSSNYSFRSTNNTSSFNASSQLNMKISGTTYLQMLAQSGQPTFAFTAFAQSSGVDNDYKFTLANSTGATASTEKIGFNWVSGTLTHANGSYATQRDYVIAGRTHAFASGTQTITDAITLDVTAPILGTSAAFTNSYAIKANGNMQVTSGLFVGTAAIATNATTGFVNIPSCAGTPTGTPSLVTGLTPMVYDSSANKIWFYNGSWRGVAVA